MLDGFLSTWDKARKAFGYGAPPTGERFDEGARLCGLRVDVRSAAAELRWSGAAAVAFEARNDDLHDVLGTLAELDRRLATQIDRCAQIVTAGRRDLDAVRQQVQDAATAAPSGRTGEQVLLAIVGWGLGELSSIVSAAHADLTAIGDGIRTIGEDYRSVASLGR